MDLEKAERVISAGKQAAQEMGVINVNVINKYNVKDQFMIWMINRHIISPTGEFLPCSDGHRSEHGGICQNGHLPCQYFSPFFHIFLNKLGG